MGVMDLVERGKLSLDAPINTILRSWKLPENELTAKTPVTLRLLLSHSGGTTVHGFPGYANGRPRPKLTEVLEGQGVANTAPVLVDLAPNTKFRYSGGGTTIVQAAVVDHTSLPFPEFMRRTVLGPLGMSHSTYEQPLPASRRAAAATAYRLGGREVEGKGHVYPEMAAAGLWTTPSDLAKAILEIQNALAGRPTKVLTIDAASHMVTPRLPTSPISSIGIGFFTQEQGAFRYFTHGGSNEGFRAMLMGSVDGSSGAVVMTNSDSGSRLAQEVLNTVIREYRWPGYTTAPLQPVAMADADSARFAGRFELESKDVVVIRQTGERLEILDRIHGPQPLYPLADGTLARADRDNRYAITPEGITVVQGASGATPKRNPARRLPADVTVGGDELLALGRLDEALVAYRERFRNDPKSLPQTSLNNAGFGLLSVGRVPEALAVLQLNTELFPTSAVAWESLAEVLLIAGENERAIAALEELLRRIDSDPTATPEMKDAMRRMAPARLKQLKD
jgi:CubicO group peptidase (beta-lactamase class C family)